ncbi:3-hydroxyacyl-CoA dehydrogenase family protein [Corynebacterium vitaeruminis]|uniref:3-hydroxybutyryl-CoA dehydrogenase n=1 Tax=Corynebacterium vitaeruminis DSM 20294 TaxID=1224164 RepID=W5Y3K0_9CORY|nr:3-hydroxyacyl-CoA dehydrogenase family protein [Corynebacterium vitaeruminis]AHI23469.1 3-hydroxybutyryl-CoA dehydrogenase [Corynebacterium vitaeruminis DSM 20294]
MATTAVPATIGVMGGGRMGAGIAHGFLSTGARVICVDFDPDGARARIERDIDKSFERGATGDKQDWYDRLETSDSVEALAGLELVIEAVPEIFSLKEETFRKIAEVAPGAILATNTSSLSITDLASSFSRPERVLGLHFFNPVPASKLVEIVWSERTDSQLVDKAKAWVEALGKTPIVVKDSPGFASSRLGVVIALEAIRMVEEGVASPRDIDNAMVLGYKFPIGPLELTDIVGLDVRLGIAEYLESTLGERFAPPQLMRDMVARGELGRKSGKGFYDYSEK